MGHYVGFYRGFLEHYARLTEQPCKLSIEKTFRRLEGWHEQQMEARSAPNVAGKFREEELWNVPSWKSRS